MPQRYNHALSKFSKLDVGSNFHLSPRMDLSLSTNRGIGFYGSPPGNHSVGKQDFIVDLSDTATLDLITFAADLSKELYPDAPELPAYGPSGRELLKLSKTN